MPIQTKITDGHTKILPCDKNWNIEGSKHCKCHKELILRQIWIGNLPKFRFLTSSSLSNIHGWIVLLGPFMITNVNFKEKTSNSISASHSPDSCPLAKLLPVVNQ